ncbi:MAG TPA: ribonuclease P protein component [Gammaproteobacteria bacterium]|jgi:ribonuclease P protein component|nr:ribonuclease P protein component [Gammaproteobacteria bacterium]HAY41489.1 ribonuclease P protein component [Gammaproteobacteria bacterium]|tara:strand:+ start:574 stop:909 length:336 start_codon:yes stop_codon:yes gene_type:complete
MDNRLTRQAKILKASEYKEVFSSGQKRKGEYWTVIAKPNNLSLPRLGLAISKKVSRLAVERNRLKRIAREVFRNSKTDLASLEFVVMSKNNTNANNSALSRELLMLLKKFN